jgi:hypothetical protein
MTEQHCRYSGDRNQAIVSYLYSDDGGFDLAERASFAAHLATCDRCRTELAAFEGVRASLGHWSPPSFHPEDSPMVGEDAPQPLAVVGGGSWWRDIPAWAQVAAALLFLGVGAGIANLDVRYDATGLQVRTGWSGAAPAPVTPVTPVIPVTQVTQVSQPAAGRADSDAPWRTDLAALEQRLLAEVHQPSPAAATAANSLNGEVLRRVRALVDDSERRQQRELALRLAEAVRDVNAQRQADLVRIDRNIGAIQNNTGREMLRQRNEMLNYVSVRTALQRPQ